MQGASWSTLIDAAVVGPFMVVTLAMSTTTLATRNTENISVLAM